ARQARRLRRPRRGHPHVFSRPPARHSTGDHRRWRPRRVRSIDGKVMSRNHALLGLSLVVFLRTAVPAQQPAAQAPETADDIKAHDTFVRVCTKCHPAERATAEGRSRSQWEATIISMQTARGAVITPEEFDTVLDYLSKHFGRQSVVIPGAGGRAGQPGARGPRSHVGAADRHRVDDVAAERGKITYDAECASGHGPGARATRHGANRITCPLTPH